MTYPRIEIFINKVEHNTRKLVDMCSKYDIQVAGVTKVFCGYRPVAEAMVKGGVSLLADSRIENFEKVKDIDVPKLLLRLPMISQAERVVAVTDISLNSELETMKVLSQAAIKIGKIHQIILMVDLGDLREGIFNEKDVYNTVEEIIRLQGLELIGLGTNLTCYGGVVPRQENLNMLTKIKDTIEKKYSITLKVISGGNSSTIHLLESGEIPKDINQLRLGESIVLGRETAFGDRINDTFDDCFKLIAEIIEIKEKPSIPIGEIGMDAFGNKPTFIDKGVRKRAICAVGKQDVSIGDVIPDDEQISILGSSSDHFILDVTECSNEYKVGDKVTFNLTYGGILSTTTSEYVEKVIK